MEDLHWDDLQLFLAAHEAGSFSAAARFGGLEQSTLSRRIARLETQLGEPLFVRSRGGLALTERGERVLPLAEAARLQIREITELGREASGTVRIALTESMANYGLLAQLPQLWRQAPSLRIELVTSDLLSDLDRREADLALRFVKPQRGDLLFRQVGELECGLWGHKELSNVAQGQQPWIELRLPGVPTPERDWALAHFSQPARLICDSYNSVVEALRQGLGVSVVADILGTFIPELKRWPTPEPIDIKLPLYLVGHQASRHTPRIATVWRFLERIAADWR